MSHDTSGMLDDHLNVFYSYKTNHIEDNVTRSLIITLSQLSPVHLRSFLRDVVLKDKRSLRGRIDLLAAPDFAYDLQIGTREDDPLTIDNGVIVGITWSGSVDLAAPTGGGTDNMGRPDALLFDSANAVTVIF